MWMSNSAVVCQEFKYLIWWYTILDHSLDSSPVCFAQRKHSFQALIPHTEKNLASSTDIEITYNQVFYTEKCRVLVLRIRPLTPKTLPIPVFFCPKTLHSCVPSSWEVKCSNSDALSYSSPSVLWLSRMDCKTQKHGCTACFSGGWESNGGIILAPF